MIIRHNKIWAKHLINDLLIISLKLYGPLVANEYEWFHVAMLIFEKEMTIKLMGMLVPLKKMDDYIDLKAITQEPLLGKIKKD